MSIKYVHRKRSPGSSFGSDGEKVKYYNNIISVSQASEPEVALRISQRCTVKPPDVRGVLTALEEVFAEQIKAGAIIHLGEFGMFGVGIELHHAKDNPLDILIPDSIKRIKLNFTPRKLMSISLKDPDVHLEYVGSKFSNILT